MKEFTYRVKDPQGLHARPAGELVKEANEFECSIQISKGGLKGDCKQIFGVIGLGVKQGETISLKFDGPDEFAAYKKISSFIQSNV